MTNASEAVRQRLQDAEFLWAAKRQESTFTLLLVALAATSRSRRPWPIRDGEAFEGLLNDHLPVLAMFQIEHQNKPQNLSQLLYKILRCELVRESSILQIAFLPKRVLLRRPIGSMDDD